MKKLQAFAIFSLVSLSMIWLFPLYGFLPPSGNYAKLNGDRNLTVLLWHWPFNVVLKLKGDVCWDLHQIPNCRLVDQHSLYSQADFVVFHNRELITGQQKLPLHLPRPKGQRWVWYSLESPENNGNLRPFSNIFNLTMFYKRDADISTPYGSIVPREPENEDPGSSKVTDEEVANLVNRNRTHVVCWVVSNFQNRHYRTKVYKELNAVVPVQGYGRGFQRPLAGKDFLSTISRCYFYLAFENSVAKDYITEKMWRNSYESGAVPVVLGTSLEDYKAVAPPHSFLHVNEFPSIKDLGQRLVELANDKVSYASYHAWKKKWKLERIRDPRNRMCLICSRYTSFPQEKVYADLDSWQRE